MNDRPDNTETETPMRRALRLKQEALSHRTEGARGGPPQREQVARMAAGKSKPALRK
ncbi:MAG TPA: hypothetical protein VG248_17790 [Caulobacteraceae bacterium]|jgi:hypothetical protein|nr:hypothetical protein [Caulobacteraceae bacterium]